MYSIVLCIVDCNAFFGWNTLQSQREATEWVAMTGHAMKLCIIGAWTHLGYNLLSSIVDGTVFGKHSQDIDIYLHDRYVRDVLHCISYCWP